MYSHKATVALFRFFQSMTTIHFQFNFINFTKRRFRLTKTQKLQTVRPRQGEPDCSAALVFAAIVCFFLFCFVLFCFVFVLFFFAVVAFSHLESSPRKTVAIIA